MRPVTLTNDERMWIAATLRTYARDYHQWVQDPENNTWFDPEAKIEFDVNWIEKVVLSGKPIDSPQFQGA